MRVSENFLCDTASARHRTGLSCQISLAASLFLALVLALPVVAQEDTPAEETPPDAVGEADEARDDEEKSETGSNAAETAPSDTEPTDSPADEPDTPVAEPDEDIEEILVKGSSQATKLDEPISIVQFGVDQMRAEGIRDIRDLSNFTPSLEIKTAFAATNPTIFIRGVGLDDFNANSVSAVTIVQDGVVMNSGAGQLFGFFDLEGVEVLRGPQGTLYRNASAGAILVHSQKPTDEFDAFVSSSYGRFDQIELEAAIGGPIIPDLLSGRISGSWAIRDGLTTNRCAGLSREELDALPDEAPCGQKNADRTSVIDEGLDTLTNDIDGWAARAQLLLTMPPELLDMDWLLNVHAGQNKSRAFQYQHTGVKFRGFSTRDPDIEQPILPIGGLACGPPDGPPELCSDASGYVDDDNDPFAGDYDVDGPENLDLFGGALTGTWRFGDSYELESITAYEWHDRFTQENTDSTGRFQLTSFYLDTAWQVSQEFKLHGEWPQSDFGDGSWILGTFYIQEDLDVSNQFDQDGGLDLLQTYTQTMRNFAAFVLSEYKLQPECEPVSCDFTLITGLRYNLEYKEFDIEACGGIFVTTGQCASTIVGNEDSTWDGLSGEISLAWHFYEDNSVYLKFARGWKGGHFNGGASGRFDIITGVDPEIVDSFEAGIRSNWFDGRLMLNVTAFYYDYQDLQVFQLEPTPAGFPIFQLVNANDALVFGVEIDMTAEPLPGLNITFNGSWVEAEYLDFTVGIPFQRRIQTAPGQPPITIVFDKEFDYSGNPLIAAPQFSITGSISYEIPLPGSIGTRGLGFLTPRFSFSWKDDIMFDGSGGRGVQINFPEGTFGQPAFWIYNASIGWRSENSGFEIIGWVRNFLDTHYKVQAFDLTRGFGFIQSVFADPRTYGMTVTLTF